MSEDLYENYLKKFKGMTYPDIAKQLAVIKSDKDYVAYCRFFLNEYLNRLSAGYESYGSDPIRFETEDFQIFCNIALSIEKEAVYFPAIAYFFKGKYEKCLEKLKNKNLIGNVQAFNYDNLVSFFLLPFKNAFPGFWSNLAVILKGHKVPAEVVKMCEVFNGYYNAKSNESRIAVLEKAVARYGDVRIYQDLLGIAYYNEKSYNMALSYLERIVDNYNNYEHVFDLDQIYFWMGYATGNLKDHKGAIEYYKKAYELNNNLEYLCNNLGYEYYLTKQYDKALKLFKLCLDNKWDFPYAPNNYASTLCAMGRVEEAKQFVNMAPIKIWKSIVDKINKAKPKNTVETSNEDECGSVAVQSSKIKYKQVKEEQFSSEKILEDELENRILSGCEVFGKKLKMYKRRGEYGRQYIIPDRRIDLLTEDDAGNLYVIELKKDSGYDDPYKQIIEYIEWIKKNKAPKGKKVSGILCLNSPSRELVKKVKADDRVELYEYVVSYNKVE